MSHQPAHDLIGRDEVLSGLAAVVSRALGGDRASVLVAGQAGIGKTSLVRAAATTASSQGARVAWGTCVEGGAPGYWPWAQVLAQLVRSVGADRARQLAGDEAPLLATIATGFGDASRSQSSDRARLLLLDATTRWLDALAAERPVVVVFDDLQWADESSLAMLDFVARAPQPASVCLIGAYRHDEISPAVRERLGALVAHGNHVEVEGLDREAVHALVQRVAGREVDPATTDLVHRRTGGHPFFVRELALLVGRTAVRTGEIPVAVRDAIERRIRRLPTITQHVLDVAAVVGTDLMPDVIASTLAMPTMDVDAATRPALDANVLAASESKLRFSHDLFRETILGLMEPARRVALHHAVATALEDRMMRAGDLAPSELARHFTAAIPLDGTERAARWALAAAAADGAALAFGEAAAHLRRLRAAVADAGAVIEDRQLCDVLVAEADALARNGRTVDARGLLRMARDVADRCGDPARITRAALAVAHLGARFAARRDDIVRELESALAIVAGTDPCLEAQLTAVLARELQHSVPEDRPRAGPLSERALELGRRTGSPPTLAACLLARHDVLWTPGAELPRAEIAREIVAVARRAGDQEGEAEGLLLLANALLEHGSSAFEAAVESSLGILDRLDQPRHRYTAETRRACVALLRGRLDEASERIDAASDLGERIREPDVGNVRMSQRLELARARADPDELRAFAAEAVTHWSGAPVHAHAVAAGFLARAGDLDAARYHVGMVLDLGTWRADRSYLWSVFVHELSHAAIALADRTLCTQLLEDLLPLAGSCGVNGAVVAFAGSHAHTAGLLAAALGQTDTARSLLEQACATYERLGAAAWYAEGRRHLDARPSAGAVSSLRRRGTVWHITHGGREVTVPHVKGLADIAILVRRGGAEVHVLELFEAPGRPQLAGDVVDRQALTSYRRRLVDLDDDLEEASRHQDLERTARLSAEREALLEEVSRVTGLGGRHRQFANHPAERARKAVAARIHDAIRKLEAVTPEVASHFERTIVTGTYCRYRGEEGAVWEVDLT
ncbi:MAG: AAA family ATPase [Actinobacteria bacterium]|nr:AAA family ATPase [Actinomycetota bacterium]